MKYDSKVSTLEEIYELDLMTVDEIHGIFTSYEMRTWLNEPSIKEVAFKVSKEPNKSETPSKNHLESLDDEKYLFIKKLERGTDKYRGKLPLKYFNCGRIIHFASKCLYPK